MKIVLGADHGGYRLKNKLIKFLEARDYGVADLGTHNSKRCDYPPVGYKVTASVSQGMFSRGILICKTGIGFSIVANKLPGIRAALCLSKSQAIFSRQHNNANVLCLAANYLSFAKACDIVDAWLKTEFSGARHARRVRQIGNIEKKIKKM
ncbi:MAG: ribose 5-phosphate isomerase B [Candidatus Omnitrophica bacterium]|nr:ribose 5-phosphate isomerase B [Candidatus Omnitrophota bacterium]